MTICVERDALDGNVQVALLPAAPYSTHDPISRRCLGVSLGPQRGVHAIGTNTRTDFDIPSGVLAYTPVGMPVFSESSGGGEYLIARWLSGVDAEADVQGTRRLEVKGQAVALRTAFAIRRALLCTVADGLWLDELLVRFLALCPGVSSVPKPLAAQAASVSRVLDKIHDEFRSPLTLTELATEAGQTALQFLRVFRSISGMTPHAYVMECRQQAARALIAGSDMPLSAVAVECGFSHQSHMGRLFRASLGMTPQQYRRLCRRR